MVSVAVTAVRSSCVTAAYRSVLSHTIYHRTGAVTSVSVTTGSRVAAAGAPVAVSGLESQAHASGPSSARVTPVTVM
eukprot:1540023-Rhodomonas_salina.2